MHKSREALDAQQAALQEITKSDKPLHAGKIKIKNKKLPNYDKAKRQN